MNRARPWLLGIAALVLALSVLYSWAAGYCAAKGDVLDPRDWRCRPLMPLPVNLQRDIHRT